MSTIPKKYTDNYSKNVKKIDSKGNLKAHPRTKKKQTLAEYSAELVKGGATTKDTTSPAPSKAIKPVFSRVKEAVGEGMEKARRSVDYDEKDRTTYKKRW